MPVTLKLKCLGEVHRLQLQEENVTYEGVCEKICITLPELGTHTVKYPDDEGDLCTLCASTFQDFLSLAGNTSGQQILKLEIVPTVATDASFAASSGNETDAGLTAHQTGGARPAPPFSTDEAMRAMEVASQSLQKPEVQDALQNLQCMQGMDGMQSLLGLAQAFAGPVPATGAAATSSSSVAGQRTAQDIETHQAPGLAADEIARAMAGASQCMQGMRNFAQVSAEPATASSAASGSSAPQHVGSQDDETVRAMFVASEALRKPEVQQALQSLQFMQGMEGMQGLLGCAQAFAGPEAACTAAAGPSAQSSNGSPDLQGVQGLAQAFMGGVGASPQSAWARGPAEGRSTSEDDVKSLVDMGFGSAEEMRALLEACGGNMQMAIQSLTK